MKILMLYAYYEPEIAASLYLYSNLSEDLAKEGFDIEIFTPIPSRGVSDDIRNKYKDMPIEILFDGKLKIHRFSMPKEGKKTLKRALRYFYLNIKLFFKGLFTKADLIFLYSTPPTQGLMGAILKFFKRIPFIYYLQDIFPDSMVNAGMIKKKSVIYKIGRRIENISYKAAEKIIVISEDFKKNIMAKGVPEEKIEIIYNWVDENKVINIDRENNKLFQKYNLDKSKFYITHCGNIGLSQNMEMLVKAAKELEEYSDIEFVIIGDGAFKPNLENLILENKSKNIKLLPFAPYEDISHVFSLGDVSLVISKPGTGENSVPSKTWSIMSAERPVLASFDSSSELFEIIKKSKAGIFVESGDPEAFKNAVLYLYYNVKERNEFGKNGRKYILGNLTREKGTNGIINSVNNLF